MAASLNLWFNLFSLGGISECMVLQPNIYVRGPHYTISAYILTTIDMEQLFLAEITNAHLYRGTYC